MGYRSDVLIIYHGPKEVVQAFAVAAKLSGMKKAIAEMSFKDSFGDCALGARFNGVKWYTSYPDVRTHEDLWDYAQEFKDLSGSFCRIGEEDDDNQKRSFGEADDPISINRSISYDYDF